MPYGGSALLLIVLLALALFYWRKGAAGRPRARPARSALHPLGAQRALVQRVAFVVLAVSGIVMAFGKVLPAAGDRRHAVRLVHLRAEDRATSPAAVRGVAAGGADHLRARQPADQRRRRAVCSRAAACCPSTRSPRTATTAARRCCSGSASSGFGLTVVGSGVVLDKLLPNLLYTRDQMQIAHMIHAVAAIVMLACSLATCTSAASA